MCLRKNCAPINIDARRYFYSIYNIMGKMNKTLLGMVVLFLLIMGWYTIDLIHMFSGWHLAFRIALNVISVALFVASLLVSKKPK